MFDILKIQEQVIFGAVAAASDAATATQIVYGDAGASLPVDNPTWVKSTMQRLEDRFDAATVQQLRLNCQSD